MSLPEFVLGTVQLGQAYGINNITGKPNRHEAFRILELAYENGIKTLDTASAYGDSEEIIGEFHRSTGRRFKVCTKLPVEGISRDDLPKAAEESAKRLGIEKIFLLYLHRFEQIYQEDVLEGLLNIKAQGIIEDIGVSIYEPQELDKIIKMRNIPFDVVQIPFNILDNIRWKASLNKAKENGIKIFARSVFLQGLLFKAEDDATVQRLGAKEAVKAIQNLAGDKGVSLPKLLLDYNKSRGLDGILVGCEKAEQLKESVELFKSESVLDESDLEYIKEISRNVPAMVIDPRKW